MKVKKAIIPAAGFGTRFLPASKTIPKEMFPLVDKPTIHYVVKEAFDSGIEEILIITGRNKQAIEDYFDHVPELEGNLKIKNKEELLNKTLESANFNNIFFLRQKKMEGLGHAILMGEKFFNDEPFAILLGDNVINSKTPCLKQLIDIYEKDKTSVLAVRKVNDEDVSKYGIIKGEKIDNKTYAIKEIVEKPTMKKAPSNIAVLGRYIFTNDMFKYLKTQKKGKGGEIQLTDSINRMLQNSKVKAYEFDGDYYDVGDKMKYLKANIDLALKKDNMKDELMKYLMEKTS